MKSSPWREPDVPAELLRALFGNVTKPIDPDIECDRAIARRVQTADQDPDRPAISGNRGDVVLGIARFRSDRDAQSRWLAEPRREAFRSAD